MSELRKLLFRNYYKHIRYTSERSGPYSISNITKSSWKRTFHSILSSISEGGQVLDIGCGVGDFLAWIVDNYPINAIGIDESEDNIAVLNKEAPNISAYIGDGLAYLKHSNTLFDCIICRNVLEHIANDDILLELIRTIKMKLISGGVFICEVPNAANLAGNYIRYADLTHCRSFTYSSLYQLLLAGEFDNIAMIQYRPSSLFGYLRVAMEYFLHSILWKLVGLSKEIAFTNTIRIAAYNYQNNKDL